MNPPKDIQITVAIETMQDAHKTDYTAVMQYIITRMAQINITSVNALGANA
jgi:hypothetical protein